MARTGKIARLPSNIRHSLNLRLQDGELGKDLIEWLNSLPPVKRLLAREFDSRPISDKNLSEWRAGGFLDWQHQQNVRESIDRFMEFSADLDDSADITARLSTFLAAQLAADTFQSLAATSDPQARLRIIRKTVRSLQTLRNSDRTAARAERENAEWADKLEEAEFAICQEHNERIISEAKSSALNSIYDTVHRNDIAKLLGRSPNARIAAEGIVNIHRAARGEKPLPPMPPPPPDVTNSGLIQPNPTSTTQTGTLPNPAPSPQPAAAAQTPSIPAREPSGATTQAWTGG
jgi:hypothetical protein